MANEERSQAARGTRQPTSVMEDLNTLADAKANHWKLNQALDINDRGEIVGNGNHGAFVLTPVA